MTEQVQRLAEKTAFQSDADEIIKSYSKATNLIGRELRYESKLALHVLLGAILHDCRVNMSGQEIDLRLPVMLVRDTGKGKGLVTNLAQKLAKMAEINWCETSSMTTAGLVGTVEKGKRGVPQIKYGLAKDADVIVFREANLLFKTGQTRHSSDIMDYVNQILDEPCPIRIYKKLASGEIEYWTHATLFLTTYPRNVTGAEERTGFYQRFLFSFKLSSLEEAFENMNWQAQYVGVDNGKEMLGYLKPVCGRLKEMKTRSFSFNFRNARGELDEAKSQIKQCFLKIEDEDRAKEFVERKWNQLIKLTCHHTALDLRNDITGEDIKYGLGITKKSIAELDEYFGMFAGNVEYNKVLNYLSKCFRRGETEVPLRKIERALKGVNVLRIVYKMEREGRVETKRVKTAGRPKVIVKILDI